MIAASLKIISLPFLAYALGSIPWGLIFTRLFTTVDLRRQGSGNIGATNVRRVAGTFWGVMTLAGDTLKGAFPVWLARAWTPPEQPWSKAYIALVALLAVAGHLYPLYLKFKGGGKGVATSAGCFAVISPPAAGIALLVFILLVCWARRVSVASLTAAAVLPVAVWQVTRSAVLTACAAVTAVLIFLRHHDNIRRLLAGTEPTIHD